MAKGRYAWVTSGCVCGTIKTETAGMKVGTLLISKPVLSSSRNQPQGRGTGEWHEAWTQWLTSFCWYLVFHSIAYDWKHMHTHTVICWGSCSLLLFWLKICSRLDPLEKMPFMKLNLTQQANRAWALFGFQTTYCCPSPPLNFSLSASSQLTVYLLVCSVNWNQAQTYF